MDTSRTAIVETMDEKRRGDIARIRARNRTPQGKAALQATGEMTKRDLERQRKARQKKAEEDMFKRSGGK